jgi:hypothetical protein
MARREVWSFWKAMAGSLSVATTAVSSAKLAVKEPGEIGRSTNDNVRFEVFTAVTMKNAVFWDVAPCGFNIN